MYTAQRGNDMNTLTNERLKELSTMRGADSGVLEEAIKETAEMAREILSLRAQLAELREQEADAEIKWDGSEFTVQNVRDGFSYGVTQVFTRHVPPAASDLTLAGWQACRDGNWFSIKAEDVPHYRDNEGVPVREVYAISIF